MSFFSIIQFLQEKVPVLHCLLAMPLGMLTTLAIRIKTREKYGLKVPFKSIHSIPFHHIQSLTHSLTQSINQSISLNQFQCRRVIEATVLRLCCAGRARCARSQGRSRNRKERNQQSWTRSDNSRNDRSFRAVM